MTNIPANDMEVMVCMIFWLVCFSAVGPACTRRSRSFGSFVMRYRLIADAVYAEDNQATLARWYGAALATGQTVDMVRSWPDRIRAVTADSVQQAAKTWLDRRHSVTGYLVKSLQPQESHS